DPDPKGRVEPQSGDRFSLSQPKLTEPAQQQTQKHGDHAQTVSRSAMAIRPQVIAQLHRCIKGRTNGSIRLRANLLQNRLHSAGRLQMSTVKLNEPPDVVSDGAY